MSNQKQPNSLNNKITPQPFPSDKDIKNNTTPLSSSSSSSLINNQNKTGAEQMLPTALATSIESSLPVATETAKRKLDFPLPSPPTTLPHELVAKLIQRGDKKSVRMPNEFFIYRTAIVKELKLRGERIKMTEVSSMASVSWKQTNRKEKAQYRKIARETERLYIQARNAKQKQKQKEETEEKINDASKKNPTIEFIFSSLVPSSVPTQNQNQTPTIAFINELVKSQNYQPSNTNPSISIPPYNILQEHHEPQFASNLNQFSSPRSFMTASATQPINQSQDVVQAYTDMLHDFYQYQLQQQYFQNIVSNETFSNTLPLASSNESDNPAIIENGSDLRYILFE